MSPRNPHRRPRRRSLVGRIVLLVAVLVVLAFLVGGLARIGHQSGPYDANLNRSFVAQGAVLAQESNATANSVRRLLTSNPASNRLTLQADLDGLVTQADDQSSRANALASGGGVQGQFAQVFADRAQAVTALRSAFDGLLVMTPLPVSGAPALVTNVGSGGGSGSGSGTSTPPQLSTTQASSRIAAAGSILIQADDAYATVRRTLRAAAGHARLPTSRWVSNPSSWQIGAVTTTVSQIAAAPALEVSRRLVLSVVQVTPPALPSPTGAPSPTVSDLSPTTTVGVNVVLTNLGTAVEPHAAVEYSLALQSTGSPATTTATTTAPATATATRHAELGAGRSTTLDKVSFRVKPGNSYLLIVAIQLPAGQTNTVGTSETVSLQISPST